MALCKYRCMTFNSYSVALPTIPVTEGRGTATERVAAAGGCDGGRGAGCLRLRRRDGWRRRLAAATEGGDGGGSRLRLGEQLRLIDLFFS
jgi:hypothetical protein